VTRVDSRRRQFSSWHYSAVGGLFTGRHISKTPASARQSERSPPSCNTIRQRHAAVMARGQQPSHGTAAVSTDRHPQTDPQTNAF